MPEPFFSVLVTAYNRPGEIDRCIRSCLAGTDSDFEVVVVDDASTDGTAQAVERFSDSRVRLIRRERNGGISAARATATQAARGEWFVMLDSDWELLPTTLPAGVRIIRSRLEWDDSHISPDVMPSVPVTGYRERMEWIERARLAGAGSDAGHCIHSAVFERRNYFTDRRGAMEGLWELDLARHESSLWVSEVLGIQHADAENSYSRNASPRTLIPGLIREAPDMQWMYETMLARHGAEIAIVAPSWWRSLCESAAGQAFLAGSRSAGVRHSWTALRGDWWDRHVWATLVLGLAGPRVLAYAKTARRGAQAQRRRESDLKRAAAV
jgi:hypothetical protein